MLLQCISSHVMTCDPALCSCWHVPDFRLHLPCRAFYKCSLTWSCEWYASGASACCPLWPSVACPISLSARAGKLGTISPAIVSSELWAAADSCLVPVPGRATIPASLQKAAHRPGQCHPECTGALLSLQTLFSLLPVILGQGCPSFSLCWLHSREAALRAVSRHVPPLDSAACNEKPQAGMQATADELPAKPAGNVFAKLMTARQAPPPSSQPAPAAQPAAARGAWGGAADLVNMARDPAR